MINKKNCSKNKKVDLGGNCIAKILMTIMNLVKDMKKK